VLFVDEAGVRAAAITIARPKLRPPMSKPKPIPKPTAPYLPPVQQAIDALRGQLQAQPRSSGAHTALIKQVLLAAKAPAAAHTFTRLLEAGGHRQRAV
jgi:hypothetical protein